MASRVEQWSPSAELERLRIERDRLRELREQGLLDAEGEAEWREAQSAFLLRNADEIVAHHQRRLGRA